MTAMLTDKEFELFKHLIYQQVGIKLDEPKKTLLVSRWENGFGIFTFPPIRRITIVLAGTAGKRS